jgi:hypothetical protein
MGGLGVDIHTGLGVVKILVEVIDAIRIEGAGPPDKAMYLIALRGNRDRYLFTKRKIGISPYFPERRSSARYEPSWPVIPVISAF